MRLLYVIDSLAPGGAETSLAEMAPGLIRAGIQLHILPLGAQHDLASRLEHSGATVHRRSCSRKGRTGNVRSVIEIAQTIAPQLIHTTLFEADVAGRLAATILGVPASTSLVNDSYNSSHYQESNTFKLHGARVLDAFTSRFAQRFHAITRTIADNVGHRLAIPSSKFDVIPRGRDPQAFPFQSADVRARTRHELGIAHDSSVLLAIGRLEPQKGLLHLLHALPAVAAEHPTLVVLIAGKDGRSSEQLRAQAWSMPLDIRFLGHRTDVAALLAAADVFCFPSEREGFGGVLIEAMAVGCPIVASDIPTTREVLGEHVGCTGVLTPVADAACLAQALIGSLGNPSLSQSRAHRAYARFEDNYTVDRVVTAMKAFFESILDHSVE